MSDLAPAVEKVRCPFVIKATYDGKKPFHIYASWMVVERGLTSEATRAHALDQSREDVARFWNEHFPDGCIPPHVLSVHLGRMTMIADDYEWRRVYD